MIARALYSSLMTLATPFIRRRLRRRAQEEPDYGLFPNERFGRYDAAPGVRAPVWVHAVSLGETRASQPLIEAILARGLPVLLTHTTATGRAEGGRLYGAALRSGQLQQAWLPYDLPGAMGRFYRHFQPRVGLLMETEVWPNVIAVAVQNDVPIALVNARLSPKSARRAKQLGWLAREAFGALDAVLAQTGGDAQRLRSVGARDPHVVGNLKFDIAPAPAQIDAGRAWRAALRRPVLALASTREGEEEAFIAALAPRLAGSDVLVMLIPRHPQRFDEVAAMLDRAGLRTARRSMLGMDGAIAPDVQVLLGDSLGEMPRYFGAADVAIVAGSFAPLGGHNLIEASACAAPVIVGPHTFNFAQASEDAIEAGAALRATDAGDAVAQAFLLLEDSARQQAMRAAAQRFMAMHAGATDRMMVELNRWL